MATERRPTARRAGQLRVDPAVDVRYGDPREGQRVLEGLHYARWPHQGHSRVARLPALHDGRGQERSTHDRTRVLPEHKAEKRWATMGELRFEREQLFSWRDGRPLQDLKNETAASVFWSSVFGLGTAAGRVTRIEREVQTMRLIERVQLAEITTSQFEQLTGYLDAERLGLIDCVYKPETARRRRATREKHSVSRRSMLRSSRSM